MIPRRIWINLTAFLGLFALLLWWAVGNVISLDQIERPYRITATFDSSPGLQANVAVTYLGVQVGTIDRVALEDAPCRSTSTSSGAGAYPRASTPPSGASRPWASRT